MFARAERGETLEVTRHNKVIAVLVPGDEEAGRYAELAASGRAHFRPRRPGPPLPRYEVETDIDPLQALLDERDEDYR
ncbi:hypothetical protein [Stackebrandtia albiflava]